MKVSINKNKLAFTKEIQKFFESFVLPEGSLVTNHTTILDYVSSTDIFYSLGVYEDGINHKFEISVYDLDRRESLKKIIKSKPTNDLEIMLKKVLDQYGVDITSKINLNFPELFLYISKNKTIIN